MNKAIIGRKVGMTQIFAEDGIIPVLVVCSTSGFIQTNPSRIIAMEMARQ